MTNPSQQAERLLSVLADAQGRGYIGESVSQLEHALQAAHFARQAGQPDDVVLAALFHDIGHLLAPDAPQMAGLGVIDHEEIGAQALLEAGCAPEVAELVRLHVAAKRYLCAKNPSYLARLSAASRQTLEWQGGPMNAAELADFETRHDLRTALALRSWDERAKDPALVVAGLDSYRAPLEAHIRRHAC